MKVSQYYPGAVIPSVSDLRVAVSVAAQIRFQLFDAASVMKYAKITDATQTTLQWQRAEKGREADVKRAERIARKIGRALRMLESAAHEISA